jgi:hypothetical protein
MQTFVTGSGVFDPFLTVQHNGSESGYNTSIGGSNPNFDAKRGASGVTEALRLSGLATVLAGAPGVPAGLTAGHSYFVFKLDINTAGGPGDNFMALNQIQIFRSTADRNDGTATAATATAAPVLSFPDVAGISTTEVVRWNNTTDTFPAGAGATQATQVLLNGNFHQGSGEFDMLLFVDAASFSAGSGNFLQFYCQFGNPPGSTFQPGSNGSTTDGFEEWAALSGSHGSAVVPVPPGAVLALAGMIPLGIGALRRRIARCQPAC